MTDQPPAPPGTRVGCCRECGEQVIRAAVDAASVGDHPAGATVVLDREPVEFGNVHLCADGTAVLLAPEVEAALRAGGSPLYLRHVCVARPDGAAA